MTELKFDGAFDAAAPAVTGPAGLTRGQKAAVIVRLMLAHDIPAPLDRLAARQQERLAHLMTSIDQLDRSALATVVDEFVDALEATRAYEANIGVMEITKDIGRQTLQIIV